MLSKCELGLIGVTRILGALSENHTIEELNLADNVCLNEIEAPTRVLRLSEERSKDDEVCILNTNEEQLEVADSEEEEEENEGDAESQSVQQLANSIKMIRNLKVLDLSGNSFSVEITDMLFSAWSSQGRASLGQRHVDENIVHFSVQGSKCCGIKSCCRKF